MMSSVKIEETLESGKWIDVILLNGQSITHCASSISK